MQIWDGSDRYEEGHLQGQCPWHQIVLGNVTKKGQCMSMPFVDPLPNSTSSFKSAAIHESTFSKAPNSPTMALWSNHLCSWPQSEQDLPTLTERSWQLIHRVPRSSSLFTSHLSSWKISTQLPGIKKINTTMHFGIKQWATMQPPTGTRSPGELGHSHLDFHHPMWDPPNMQTISPEVIEESQLDISHPSLKYYHKPTISQTQNVNM